MNNLSSLMSEGIKLTNYLKNQLPSVGPQNLQELTSRVQEYASRAKIFAAVYYDTHKDDLYIVKDTVVNGVLQLADKFSQIKASDRFSTLSQTVQGYFNSLRETGLYRYIAKKMQPTSSEEQKH